MTILQLFIDSTFSDSESGNTRDIEYPADSTIHLTAAEASSADAERAIAAARREFDSGQWRHTTVAHRGDILRKVARRLLKDKETIARLETFDTGKTYAECEMDVDDVASVFSYYADQATASNGRVVDPSVPGISSKIVTEPVGVCVLITPWNYPLLQASWKVAPALLAGNSIILKPSELTPSTTHYLVKVLIEEGVEPAAVQLLLGAGADIGPTLTESPDVDMVSFTGGLETGRTIMKSAAGTVKRVALELGGKNPNVIFADADLPAAIDNALTAVFLDSGQVCSAGARLVVEESIHDKVVDELVRRAREIRVGDPFDSATETGSLISSEHRQKVHTYVERAREQGATLLCGGEIPEGDLAKGYFYPPTILDRCDQSMDCVHDESFGPVLTVETFSGDSDEEREKNAIAIANDTIYGLAGAVWTADASRAERVARQLRHGTIWINDYHPYVPHAEWGGMKQSGNGRELGPTGLAEYLEIKHIWHNTQPAVAGWFANSEDASATAGEANSGDN
ncbi:MAG: aldehyde dehydrogenase family protein [Actinomycetaceae bacterium]|nr:aldehyde dehydrogenase family protein [Actinomycetaceae bacterium]